MTELLGIDLNGLCDVSVDAVDGEVLRGGRVPSVVVLRPNREFDTSRLIAGSEAALAIEGRGWHWPASARVANVANRLRVPLHEILGSMIGGQPIEAAGEMHDPAELMAAAIDALARPRRTGQTQAITRQATIAVPDDGKFIEEPRQELIKSALAGGVMPTLLWRPIAAFLGMDAKFDEGTVKSLHGKNVGVISCLADGVHAAILTIERRFDDSGFYAVPVRHSAGISVPYKKSIFDLAYGLADELAPTDDPMSGWQSLWGNGLILSWLLRLPTEDTVIQTVEGWQSIQGTPPLDLPGLEFPDVELEKLTDFLKEADYLIFEGPALEAACGGMRLLYFLRERISGSAHSLNFATQNEHLVAFGCAVYQSRQLSDRLTYFDHLPQLQLAVRRGTTPDFLDLIDRNARVEGGKIYEETRNLGLSVHPGTTELEFYLCREGSAKPRHIHEGLGDRISEAVPIQLRIRQQPAQGTARLTLLPADDTRNFSPVELHWERMVEEDLSKAEILEKLQQEPTESPPIQPQHCHPLLWTVQLDSVNASLEQHVQMLASQLSAEPIAIDRLASLFAEVSILLTRRTSPAMLTGGKISDRKLYRAISTDGDLPPTGVDLSISVIELFNVCMLEIDALVKDQDFGHRKFRNALVRFGGWCFLLCPESIRLHLIDTARNGTIPEKNIYYRAMGKTFSSAPEFQAFFELFERKLTPKNSDLKLYEIEGLFYLFSIREAAPIALTDNQAHMFANKLLDRVEYCIRTGKLSRLVNVCVKAYAGLMRYRLVRPDFMSSEDPWLGVRQADVFSRLVKEAERRGRWRIADLTKDLIKWTEKQGTNRNMLQWDDAKDP
jgi:hypothetical protein